MKYLGLLLGVALLLWSAGTADAKPGRGHGMGHGGMGRGQGMGQGGMGRGQGMRGMNSVGPRGFAWGYHRNQGTPVTRTFRNGRFANPTNGQSIFRAGRNWQWDSGQNGWILQQ
jgi:hypothetical protein